MCHGIVVRIRREGLKILHSVLTCPIGNAPRNGNSASRILIKEELKRGNWLEEGAKGPTLKACRTSQCTYSDLPGVVLVGIDGNFGRASNFLIRVPVVVIILTFPYSIPPLLHQLRLLSSLSLPLTLKPSIFWLLFFFF